MLNPIVSDGSETCMYTFKRVVIAHGFLMVSTQSVSLETLQNRKGERRSKKGRRRKDELFPLQKRIARLQLSSLNRVRFSFFCVHCLCLPTITYQSSP
ncbi:hypothetical protein J3F84DRAFT_172298 [Trichoderma pleuroticola]